MDLRKPTDLDDTLAAMADTVERSALMLWLTNRDPTYAYKARELRSEVAAWLSYIPNTFPHYTRHTIDHSEEIICQISKLLFRDGNPDRLVVPDLTPVEAYILVGSSYLHDTGMVASEKEKAQILASAEWTEWTRSGTENARRLALIDDLRSGTSPLDPTVRHFLADSQLRLLIAEFVRRSHHERAADVLEAHQAQLGRFAFDDPILAFAISNVCVAHGLPRSDLDDRVRFPQETDIRGEKVNLQFCAIVLRIGDLLDLRTERACPLLLSAACPLPTESIAHWKRNERIQSRNTAPDRIEIRAACEDAAEHRGLRDWCKWIEEETNYARELMPRSRRHSAWKPPIARIGSQADFDSTMIIEPSPHAKYVPEDWRFVLDEQIVFDRLIRDVYTSPWDFLRELLQNALDAVRCGYLKI